MKTIFNIFLIFCLVNSSSLISQNKLEVSKIVYKKSVYEKKEVSVKNEKMKKVMDKVKEISERIEFNLFFDKNKSYYKMQKILDLDENSPYYSLVAGSPIEFYKNTTTNEFIKYSEVLGKPFNVVLTKNKYNWKITKETKKIGEFLCYKATGYYEEYNPVRDSENIFTPTVWFTNEIPVPFGPEDFCGLPGLVMEASLNGQTYFYVSKIELNKYNEDEIKIKKPKAKEISEKDYLDLLGRNFD